MLRLIFLGLKLGLILNLSWSLGPSQILAKPRTGRCSLLWLIFNFLIYYWNKYFCDWINSFYSLQKLLIFFDLLIYHEGNDSRVVQIIVLNNSNLYEKKKYIRVSVKLILSDDSPIFLTYFTVKIFDHFW